VTGEIDIGRYLEITLSEDVQKVDHGIVDEACVRVYYTHADLDRNGDGDANDPDDIDESTLGLYRWDETSGRWIDLDRDTGDPKTAGVEAEDVGLYGDPYAGYVWACLSDLTLFGVAGRPQNRPPDTSEAYARPDSIWPPNHKFAAVSIEGVTDPDGDDVEITITRITSDEPLPNSGGWKHSPDARGVGGDTAWLRAERNGHGNGRVYEITFLARDEHGDGSAGRVSVCVPHSQGRECVDDGQDFDVAESATGPRGGASSGYREKRPPASDRSRRR
jgi:hypothetical protein